MDVHEDTLRQWDEQAMQAWDRQETQYALDLWHRLLDAAPLEPSQANTARRTRVEANRALALQRLDATLTLYPYDVVTRLAAPRTGAADVCVALLVRESQSYAHLTRVLHSLLLHCTDVDRVTRWVVAIVTQHVEPSACNLHWHANERAALRAVYPFLDQVLYCASERDAMEQLHARADAPYVLALDCAWRFVRAAPLLTIASIVLREPICARVLLAPPPGGVYAVRQTCAGQRYRVYARADADFALPALYTGATWRERRADPCAALDIYLTDALVLRAQRTGAHESLCMSVTTCKRLSTFLRSMSGTLAQCADLGRVSRFVLCDDNSTEADREAMRVAFPFFECILKSPAQKGHARSMNLLLDATRESLYLFHTEDDFHYRTQYWLGDALTLLAGGETALADHVILRWHEYCEATQRVHAGVRYRAHAHSLDDAAIPEFFRAFRAQMLEQAVREQRARPRDLGTRGCFWPGFSLNPSVWRLEAIRARDMRFDEQLSPTLFEYKMALALWLDGYRTAALEHDMPQFPALTAYFLNDHLRDYDINGCENHRGVGGRYDCVYCCAQQTALLTLQAPSATASVHAA